MLDLRQFRALTFDVYGTLIDWETGLLAELRPWAQRHGLTVDDDALLGAFGELESRRQGEHPTLRYSDLLAEVHLDLARHYGVAPHPAAARAFGRSVPAWPAFDDTPAALAILKRHFRLCILSNVDNDSLAGTRPKLGVEFDEVFTAQDIGSYKPALRNFTYALDRLAAGGVAKEQVLHVAQSLFHDHQPAAHLGLANCWIDRRSGKRGQGAVKEVAAMPPVALRFARLADFAAAVEAAFSADAPAR